MMKSTDRGLTWSEWDAFNAPSTAVSGFEKWQAWNGGIFYVGRLSAANTLTMYRFDTDADTWISDLGVVSTNVYQSASFADGAHIAFRSDGDIIVTYNSKDDPSDILYARYEGGSWTSDISVLSATGSGLSEVAFMVVDRNDITTMFLLDDETDDPSYVTLSAANVLSARQSLASDFGFGYEMFTAEVFEESGNDVIYAGYPSGSSYPPPLNMVKVTLDGTAPHTLASLGTMGSYDAGFATAHFNGAAHVLVADYNNVEVFLWKLTGSGWVEIPVEWEDSTPEDVTKLGTAFGGLYAVTIHFFPKTINFQWLVAPSSEPAAATVADLGSMYRGDERTATISISDTDGDPVPLHGMTVWFTARATRSLQRNRTAGPCISFMVELDAAGEVVASTGEVVAINAADGEIEFGYTVPWIPDLRKRGTGQITYDVQVEDSNGRIRTLTRGTATITDDITR